MNTEIALAIRFRADDKGLDGIVDMLASRSMQFTGGGCGRIILAYDDKDEEIPPVLEPLLLGLMQGKLDFGQEMVGYIRNGDKGDISMEQVDDLKSWFGENIADFKFGDLVDLWK